MPQPIEICFIKSTLFGSRIGPRSHPQDYIDPPVIDEIEQLAEQLHTAGRVRAVINVRNFIEPPGDEVEDSPEDLIESIAELYAGPDRDGKQMRKLLINLKLSLIRRLQPYKSFDFMKSSKTTLRET